MKVLTLTEFGNPILRLKAKKVSSSLLKTKKFSNLVDNMTYTMRETGGVGLAAPQIGESLQLAVMEIRSTPTRPNLKNKGPIVIINPKIVKFSKDKVSDWEGCLSINFFRGKVLRPESITVEYLDMAGKKVLEKATGLWARIFQHEIDHLHGLGCIDKMDSKTIMTVAEFKKRILKKK